jgi:hypothetical protein
MYLQRSLTRRADSAGHNPPANMAPSPTPNARVSAEATFFDASDGPRLSEPTFGARVFGTVLSRTGRFCPDGEKSVLRFEDGNELAIPNGTLWAEPHASTSSSPRNIHRPS